MTQFTYRGNLTAAEFPFLSELQGRTIIMPMVDQNYSRQASSTKNKDRDIGIPQVYYMHNVVPTEAGLTTVAYQQLAKGPADSDNSFKEILSVRDINENFAYFANGANGRNYALTDLTIGWKRIVVDKAPIAGALVTTAHVNGQTYICYGGVGTFKYNFADNTLIEVILGGLDKTKIMGVTESNGYMIAWTATTVHWSSIVDPTDFIPSLVTGAGGGGVQETKAAIVCCLPSNDGFIIYTKKNAVVQIYSGNTQYPFNAQEVKGAGGVSDPSMVAYDGNSTNHFTYGTSGLQEISSNNAQVVFPQVTDFVSGAEFEDFDEATLKFSVFPVSGVMKKKLTMVSNRYMIISYGVSQLTHALVYDMALARWGKIKINHVDCFEYAYPSSQVADAPKRSLGFLQADGTIVLGIVSYSTTGSNGVIILGKYQHERARYIQMQEIHLESIKANNLLNLKLLTTLDGSNPVITTVPYLAENTGTYRRYNCRASGLNHSIMLSGAFHVHSIVLKYADVGAAR